jgi:hypothetical protein
MSFANVYWDAAELQAADEVPSIIAIGDSWFWYPFPGGSLLNQLGPLVASRQHTVLAFGNNGAEVYDYVYGKYAKSVREALRLYNDGSLSAVFLSGGGNDFAGFNDLRPLLNANCSAAGNADQCFKDGDDDGTLDWLMQRTRESYNTLIGQIVAQPNPNLKVFLHNYDYAFPSGKGLFNNTDGTWLKRALDDAQVPRPLQRPCVMRLVDRFSAELQTVADQNNGRVIFVDSRNTLSETDWANELHPTPGGFGKIAQQRWKPLLVDNGLAAA